MNHLSYTQGRQDIDLLDMTIGQAFDQTVARFPDREALYVPHQQLRYSWAQLAQAVDQTARAFMALGIAVGDRVGIWSPNCAQWCITQFATAKIGAILVNLNPAYRASELEYALRQSDCNWLITAGQFKEVDYHAIICSIVPDIARPGPQFRELRGFISLALTPPPGFLPWHALADIANETTLRQYQQRQHSLHGEQAVNIQYTSGTTGFPKGATLSHRNILNNGYFVGESLGLTEQDRLVIPVPLYHCFGMVMGNLGCMTHGSTMIYPSESFDALATLTVIAQEKATALYGVPTMFITLLGHPQRRDFDVSSLRTGIMAGATCPIEIMRRVIDDLHMGDVQIAYGMTETSPVSLQTRSDEALELRVTTVGRTQPHLESKIVNPQGEVVPCGEVGELCTRGYSVMLGYWNNPDATAECLDSNGWLHTGDLASMDTGGYVRIVGRNKDMIIRGGENIYPRELEEFLLTHPAIVDAHVVGIPDSRYGEQVVAWVMLAPASDTDEAQLREWCKTRIAHFKVPRHFRFTDSFPMTVTGKVQKFRMREISILEIAATAAEQG